MVIKRDKLKFFFTFWIAIFGLTRYSTWQNTVAIITVRSGNYPREALGLHNARMVNEQGHGLPNLNLSLFVRFFYVYRPSIFLKYLWFANVKDSM